jgi:hypothetical protein
VKLVDFLSLIKVLRMLYGVEMATKTFEQNRHLFYDLDNLSKNSEKRKDKIQ